MIWQVTFSLALLVLTLWMRWRKKRINTFKRLGIPGPTPNILFGNMLEIYNQGPLKCHDEWIKKYGKVFGYFFGMRPVLIVADPEILKQVEIKEFSNFTDRPNSLHQLNFDRKTKGTQHLINQHGQAWKETRSLLTAAFTSGKLKQMYQTVNEAVDLTMEIVEEKARTGREFNMHRIWQGLTADVIGRTAFGIEAGVQLNQDHILIRSARSLFAEVHLQSLFFLFGFSFKEFGRFFLFVRRLKLAYLNKMENPVAKLLSGIGEVISARRNNSKLKRADLLQSLIDAEKTDSLKNITVDKLTAVSDDSADEQDSHEKEKTSNETKKKGRFLTDDEVKANALMMYLAGYETTSTALAYTTYALLKHQEIQEKLRQDVRKLYEKEGEISCMSVQHLPYLDQVFCESLRMYPPIYLFVNRVAAGEITLGNYKIPKGMVVQVPVYWLHHNPDYWDNPEKFDPSRFERGNEFKRDLMWQPFGAGPRNCIGMRFALMEAKLAIAKLLLKYRIEPSESTDKHNIRFRITAAILSPLNGVYLKAAVLES